MKTLANATLPSLSAQIARPLYDRAALKPGIVHLGIGAFHRAHQAVMTEAVLNAQAQERGASSPQTAKSPKAQAETHAPENTPAPEAWGILAASLRSPDTRDALAPQDWLYTVAIGDRTGVRYQVIGAVCGGLVAPENPEALLEAMADPAIRIVSLTVTEKGYCHDPATGTLDPAHPDIVHDLATPHCPRSAPGFLVEALRRRHARGLPPFTILCCDNLPANGRTVKRVVVALAALQDTVLSAYIEQYGAFPCTMVDRIVPATTAADRPEIAQALGALDAWPVRTEGFTQWVIEDHFAQGRPKWELAGVEFVADVTPFEQMKLRMLNGAHSTLAYVGLLAGLEHVADAATDRDFSTLLTRFWAQVAPTLPQGAGLDPDAYAARLRDRFSNPHLRHKLAQIAMDGSQKVPQRLLGTLRECRKAGLPHNTLMLGVAAFLLFMTQTDATGAPYKVQDPLAGVFTKTAQIYAVPGQTAASKQQEEDALFSAKIGALLRIESVFGSLAEDDGLVAEITAIARRLHRHGARAVLRERG